MSETPLIEFRGIGKRYGTGEAAFVALHHIDLQIQQGEFVAIMGPSGSGKSTAMNIVGALDRPSWGEYLFDGVHVENLTNDERALLRRRWIGFVFQGFNLLPRTTAMENVELPLLYRGLKRADRQRLAAAALERVGLLEWAHHTPAELSGGQQQRVAIARAVVNNPKVLLLDEPLGALDYKLRKKMQLELKKLQRGLGITFIYVTHDQEEALTMSDRVIIVKDGRIEQDDPPAAIYQYPKSQFAAGFIGENNFFDIEGDEDHVLAVRPQFIEVSKESEDLEGTPKEPFYYGSVVELLFTGTFDKVFIRLDNTNQMVTAYQYYDDKKRWKADDRVGIRWNAEEAVKVIK